MAKNDHVNEAGKVRRSDATSVKGPLVNQPYLNWGGQIIPTYHYWPPKVFHLPVSLHKGQLNSE